MNRARNLFQRTRSRSYEPLAESPSSNGSDTRRNVDSRPASFSWIEYAIFVLLGVAMLWAWNMFLAAAPYFHRRFRANEALLSNFQAAEVSVSTVANLSCMLVLAKLQTNASYPRRVATSLIIYLVAYTLLAISTKAFLGVSAEGYFAFFVFMVLVSSIATGFMQNGTFAFASSFGRPDYMQGIMAGQGIAGVLPPMVQIISVLSAGEANDSASETQNASTAAFAYFLTATGISGVTLLAFLYLVKLNEASQLADSAAKDRREPLLQSHSDEDSSTVANDSSETLGRAKNKSVALRTLARKLLFPASAVFITFAVTMVFPVFTQRITSTNPSASRLLRDAAFIPFAFLIWNIGDLLGRLIPLVPALSLASKPRTLLLLSILRLVFIPLYLLCNISRGSGPHAEDASIAMTTVKSDVFYLLVVQFPFGVSNGFLGSCCMMGAGDCVEEDEREPAGAFMGLLLVGGLAVGSLSSFFVGNAI